MAASVLSALSGQSVVLSSHPRTVGGSSGLIVGASNSHDRFASVLEHVSQQKRSIDVTGAGLHHDLTTIYSHIFSGNSLSVRDLLGFQIRAHELGLRVELVSKVADAALNTVRKLQQQ